MNVFLLLKSIYFYEKLNVVYYCVIHNVKCFFFFIAIYKKYSLKRRFFYGGVLIINGRPMSSYIINIIICVNCKEKKRKNLIILGSNKILMGSGLCGGKGKKKTNEKNDRQ